MIGSNIAGKTVIAASALAFAMASLVVPLPTAKVQAEGPNDATYCLSLGNDNNLHNGCNFTVWASWCVENVDCRNSKLTNLEDIGGYGSYPVYGASTGNMVHWTACKAPTMPHDANAGAYSTYCE